MVTVKLTPKSKCNLGLYILYSAELFDLRKILVVYITCCSILIDFNYLWVLMKLACTCARCSRMLICNRPITRRCCSEVDSCIHCVSRLVCMYYGVDWQMFQSWFLYRWPPSRRYVFTNVCLLFCEQDYSNLTDQIFMKFYGWWNCYVYVFCSLCVCV